MKILLKTIHLIIVLTLFIPFISNAQTINILKGDFDFLKDQKDLNVEFDFSPLKFYNNNLSEEEYIQRRITEITEKKDKAEADIWLEDWERSKSTIFQNKFITLMNRSNNIQLRKNTNAKYTLIVESIWMYPGWYGGVMAQHAKLTTILKFVETADPTNVLLEIESINARGSAYGGIPNHNDRMAECYAKTGKTLGKIMKKKVQ